MIWSNIWKGCTLKIDHMYVIFAPWVFPWNMIWWPTPRHISKHFLVNFVPKVILPLELWKNMLELIRVKDLINVRCVKNVLLCPKLWEFILDNILVRGLTYAVTVVWHLYKIQLSDLIWKQIINNYSKEKTKTFMKCQQQLEEEEKIYHIKSSWQKNVLFLLFVIKFLLLMAIPIKMSA